MIEILGGRCSFNTWNGYIELAYLLSKLFFHRWKNQSNLKLKFVDTIFFVINNKLLLLFKVNSTKVIFDIYSKGPNEDFDYKYKDTEINIGQL